jgi:chemotaxis protein MotB
MSARKRKKHEEHVNHERWMVSYADFVTLLFAVFVVLFASAQSNKNTAQQVAEAVTHALQNGSVREAMRVMRSVAPPQLPHSKSPAGPNLLQSTLAILNHQLAPEIANGRVDVRLDARGLVISLRQAAFFPSGAANIEPSTYPIIDKLADVLGSLPNAIRLEGHTDPIPIRNSRFANNWELSAARSIAMLELLTTRDHIDRSRLSIAGFADTAPVASNDNEEGRAKNRRVDVVVLSGTAQG